MTKLEWINVRETFVQRFNNTFFDDKGNMNSSELVIHISLPDGAVLGTIKQEMALTDKVGTEELGTYLMRMKKQLDERIKNAPAKELPLKKEDEVTDEKAREEVNEVEDVDEVNEVKSYRIVPYRKNTYLVWNDGVVTREKDGTKLKEGAYKNAILNLEKEKHE